MQTASLVFGIISIIGLIIGFVPCLGAFNWLNIPVAFVGLVISIMALSSAPAGNKSYAVTGVICTAIAIFFGIIRLILGGGVV